MKPHLTVLIPTRNRSRVLGITLDAMSRVRRAACSVEFVVIDNGSDDKTSETIKVASRALPLKTLWEPRAGKSRALNTALESTELGDFVVFTDDDVTPDEDWLESILEVCDRWPRHSVFGGRIDPTWPDGETPAPWLRHDFIQQFAFTRHVISDRECEYPGIRTPYGPNYWVRRDVLRGMKFMPGIGPHPTKRKLGCETEFLRRLRRKGYAPVYSPAVRVEHRIESTRLSKWAIYRRAFQLGQGLVYTEGLPDAAEWERCRACWRWARGRRLAAAVARLPGASLSWRESDRVIRIVEELVTAGTELEALRFSDQRFADGPAETQSL